MNEENDKQEIYHEECLALTIRKEYRLTTIHNLFCIAGRLSFKVCFSSFWLTLLNSFI